jgi:exodeoxyribonuclease VII small subunit
MATFEEQLAQLEVVVEKLELGGLPLEESVQLFEDGVRLSQACKERLANAESRIQKLAMPEGGGAVRFEDLDADALVDDDLETEVDVDDEEE